MRDSGSFASLTPTLLARKGAAKPAMRPQLQQLPHYTDALAEDFEDDLGWNDHGHDLDAPAHESAEIVPIGATPVPEVVRQQAAIAKRIAAPRASRERRSALDEGRRAAFTLRVDAERHLKLRLACTVRNRSAQQLMTEALDRLLADLPDLSTLAAQVAKQR